VKFEVRKHFTREGAYFTGVLGRVFRAVLKILLLGEEYPTSRKLSGGGGCG